MKKQLIKIQKSELIGAQVYKKLALIDKVNQEVFTRIANDEMEHFNYFMNESGAHNMKLNLFDKIYIQITILSAIILGTTFTVKQLERSEAKQQKAFLEIAKYYPKVKEYIIQEEIHEQELLDLVDEDKLKYMSSIVLGLNDALVELTGALAGFSISIQNSRMIGLLGLITGISAAFSMASSEYLSTKSEQDDTGEYEVSALKASAYTGIAYIFTVFILVAPFFFTTNYMLALAITIVLAVVIIFKFNYYISVAKDLQFKKRFIQMAVVSLGVAFISFMIGYVVKTFLGFEL